MLSLVSQKYTVKEKVLNLNSLCNMNTKGLLVTHRRCCWTFQVQGCPKLPMINQFTLPCTLNPRDKCLVLYRLSQFYEIYQKNLN